MKFTVKHVYYICSALAFIAGCFFEYGLKNYTSFHVDKQIDPVEFAILIVTIVIAVVAPILVEKLIENVRGVKIFLIDEIKELINITKEIESIIEKAHDNGVLSKRDRRDVLYKFHLAGLKIVAIREQVLVAFKEDAHAVSEILIGLLFEYQDYLTGGAFMHESFTKISESFYHENATQYSKLELGLKKLIQQVYRF